MTAPSRKTALGRAAVLALAMAFPVSTMAESLSDAMVQAYDSSPLLEQQRALLRATDEDVAVAVSALRPIVSGQASYSKTLTITDERPTLFSSGDLGRDRSTTTSSSLALILQYTLLDGGQRYLRLSAAKEAVLATRFGLVQQEQAVLLDAVSAYLNLRLAVLTVDVRENNVRLITQQLRAAEDRFEVGEVTRTDVALAQSRLASARSLLAAARGQVDVARENYRLTVGVLPTGVLQAPPAPPALPPSVDRAQALALQIHPLILSGQHEITAAVLLADAAEADRLPSIDLEGQLSYSRPDTSTANIGLVGRVPIYNGGRLSALNRAAIANAQATRAALNQQSRVIVDGVGAAWAALEIARAQIVASREGVRAAELAFEGFREEALLGARTTLDVLDSEQELLDARTAVLEAETDAQLAVYQVLASIGLLTTDHLGLTVERYDPTEYYRAVSNAPAISPEGQGGRLDRVLRRFGRN
ncbi:MAG: TolC family outer membrane protein [Pseudomonadota bacterium]